jgi:hypothetical protein
MNALKPFMGIIKLGIGLILVIATGFWVVNGLTSATTESKPKTYEVPSTSYKPAPTKSTALPPPKPQRKRLSASSLANDYHEMLYDTIMYNSFGTLEMSKEVEQLVMDAVTNLYEEHSKDIFNAFKHYKVNLAALDTMKTPYLGSAVTK